jgi:hypothetical protein
MNTKSIFALLITLSLLSACAQSTPTGVYPPPVSIPVTPTTIAVYPGPTSVPTVVPPTPTHIPVDLTPAQMAAIQAVSDKYNIPVDQVQITSTEAKTWPSGCLGVVIPGVMCTNMIVQGFSIKLEANGQQFEIHTNQDGTSVVDAAQQLGTLGFVVSATDRTIQVINPNIPLGPTYNPAFTGFLPAGGSLLGTAYVLDFSSPFKAVAVKADGQQDLPFIKNPNYALAVWRGSQGSQSWLAWGTQPTSTDQTSSLQISAPDGSQLETLLTIDSTVDPRQQLVAELWSADGKSLYFSKEPWGIGGYILFSGASNLYKIDIATKQVSEVIPQTPPTNPQTCLDAISLDYRFVADHCTQNVITIRDLQNGGTTTIQAPADVTGYRLMGSARFSPTGDRIAYALAQGDPSNERGWVAIGDRSGGVAKLILAGDAGSYYTVLGWLDDQTILVQSNSIVCDLTCGNQVLTVGVDGSNPTKVSDGSFLTVIDNR